jgi:hypothetical protein
MRTEEIFISDFSRQYSVVIAKLFYFKYVFPNSYFLLYFSSCRGLKAEKIAARQAILPLIQAEEDARFDSEFLFINLRFRVLLT